MVMLSLSGQCAVFAYMYVGLCTCLHAGTIQTLCTELVQLTMHETRYNRKEAQK